jgi:glycosyltransferase involved in cell wall biosynthesis
MISILIPVFNYNITALVSELNKQAKAVKIDFEIIGFDDKSTNQETIINNSKINTIANCEYIENPKNIGRTAARNALAKLAKYEHLLFLDADVLPTKDNFLNQYITYLATPTQMILGGLAYRLEDFRDEVAFRWFYGTHRESKSADQRNENPFKYILSGNFMIRKATYMALKMPEDNCYGMDIYFSYLLYQKNTTVLHIDNPVFHLGLESNAVFLKKSLEAVSNRKKIMANLSNADNISPLLTSYKKIKKWHLESFTRSLFILFEPVLKKLIFKKIPNLMAFDLYRLGYLCESKRFSNLSK